MPTENTLPAQVLAPEASTQTSPSKAKQRATVKSSKVVAAKKRIQKPVKKVVTSQTVSTSRKSTATAKKTQAQATTPKSVKPTKQPIAKPTAPAKPKPSVKVKTVAETKFKKPKLVRDSFTIPKDEYQAIAALKIKALSLKHSVKKSEILRAGLMLISSLNDKAFLAALNKVPALKTGRPANS